MPWTVKYQGAPPACPPRGPPLTPAQPGVLCPRLDRGSGAVDGQVGGAQPSIGTPLSPPPPSCPVRPGDLLRHLTLKADYVYKVKT